MLSMFLAFFVFRTVGNPLTLLLPVVCMPLTLLAISKFFVDRSGKRVERFRPFLALLSVVILHSLGMILGREEHVVVSGFAVGATLLAFGFGLRDDSSDSHRTLFIMMGLITVFQVIIKTSKLFVTANQVCFDPQLSRPMINGKDLTLTNGCTAGSLSDLGTRVSYQAGKTKRTVEISRKLNLRAKITFYPDKIEADGFRYKIIKTEWK